MQRLTEETRYDDAAQRQIIALAAELQRSEREGATLADLEARAREAGIDPRYVRMAAGHSAPPGMEGIQVASNPVERPWYQNNEITLVAVIVFSLMQMFTVMRLMEPGGKSFPAALLFAPILGLAFSRNTAHRLGAIAALAGSTFTTVVLMLFASSITHFQLSRAWLTDVVMVGLLEFAALLIGFMFAAAGRLIRDRIRQRA
jgi:hypothetical protein